MKYRANITTHTMVLSLTHQLLSITKWHNLCSTSSITSQFVLTPHSPTCLILCYKIETSLTDSLMTRSRDRQIFEVLFTVEMCKLFHNRILIRTSDLDNVGFNKCFSYWQTGKHCSPVFEPPPSDSSSKLVPNITSNSRVLELYNITKDTKIVTWRKKRKLRKVLESNY